MRGDGLMEEPAGSACWMEAAYEHLHSAQVLLLIAEGCAPPEWPAHTGDVVRSCLSRSYYAAYAACCAWFQAMNEWYDGSSGESGPVQPVELPGKPVLWYPHSRMYDNVGKAFDWQHGQGADRSCDAKARKACQDQMLALLGDREDADYKPHIRHSVDDAADAVRRAAG